MRSRRRDEAVGLLATVPLTGGLSARVDPATALREE